jgi:DNA-binding beta-propeller fold protein YncE
LSDTIHRVTPDGVESLYAGQNIRYEVSPMRGGAGYRNGPREQALFRTPWGIVADDQDNLYVADSANAAIRKISPDGIVSTFFGRAEADPMPSPDANNPEPGSIAPPNPGSALGIARDRLGNFYLAGTDNRIHKLSPDGQPTELAGSGHRCVYWICWSDCATPPPQNCYTDGPGPTARFDLPRDIGVDDQGVVYVLDGTSDLRIRAIE